MRFQLTVHRVLLPSTMALACSMVMAQSAPPRPGDLVGPRPGDMVALRPGDLLTSQASAGVTNKPTPVRLQCSTHFTQYQNLGEVISVNVDDCSKTHHSALQGNKAYGSSTYYNDYRIWGTSGSYSDNFGNSRHTQGTTQPHQKLWVSGLAKDERVLAEVSYSASYAYKIKTYRADLGWAYSRHNFTVDLHNGGAFFRDSGWIQHNFVGYEWSTARVGHWTETGKSRYVGVSAPRMKPHWKEVFKKFEDAPPLHENTQMSPTVELDVCKIDGSTPDLSFGARQLFRERFTKKWNEWDGNNPSGPKTPVGVNYKEGQYVRPDEVNSLSLQINLFTLNDFSGSFPDVLSRGLRPCANLVLNNWRQGTIPVVLTNGEVRMDLVSGSSTQESGAYIAMDSSTLFRGIRILDPLQPGSTFKLERPPLLP
jgi:hypothetical protein